MDKRAELQSTLRIEGVPTVRSMVAQKLREAIMSGKFKPAGRRFARRFGPWKPTGLSRPSRIAVRWSAPSASRKQNSFMRPEPSWKGLPAENAPASVTLSSCGESETL